MSSRSLLVVGYGGHARVCEEIALQTDYSDVFFVDDAVMGEKVVGKIDYRTLVKLRGEFEDCIVGIGNNSMRSVMTADVEDAGYKLINLIHPTAIVSRSASIGNGVLVCAGSVIGVNSVIANGVIVNTGVIVDHDCKIDSYVHLAPGSTICGGVTVGTGTLVGANSTVLPCIGIGRETILGAGAIVTKEIGDGVVATGAPARAIKANR